MWRTNLDGLTHNTYIFHEILSSDERERAHRFFFREDRDRFIVGRAVLRMILARYIREAPHLLRFRYGPHGKPSLAHDGEPSPIRFNVSHSEGLALYAITRGKEIGIDVEYARTGVPFDEIAGTVFSPRELSVLRSLPPERRQMAFFTCWTRKGGIREGPR